MKLTLHHLNNSRSARILWLLEEAGLSYDLIHYQRDPVTHLAPDSLKAIHPLGKSPVLEIDGKVIVESGAIVEYLIAHCAPHLAPPADSPEFIEYLQWIHFAESSAMLPVLLKVFGEIEMDTGTRLNFLEDYANTEFDKVFRFLEHTLADRSFILGDTLSGADIMLGFVVSTAIDRLSAGGRFPHISRYAERLKNTAGWQKAQLKDKAGQL